MGEVHQRLLEESVTVPYGAADAIAEAEKENLDTNIQNLLTKVASSL
jgi:hypothetical protein